MIPETTPEKINEAMERFDRELREASKWKNWEQKEEDFRIFENGVQ